MRLSIEQLFGDPPVTGWPLGGVEWRPGRETFTYLLPGAAVEGAPPDLWEFDIAAGERRLLLPAADLPPAALDASEEDADPGGEPAERPGDPPRLPLKDYQWSMDGDWLLLSAKGRAYRCDPETRAVQRLVETMDAEAGCGFCPAGARFAFVRGGNLWTYDLQKGGEQPVTTDGDDAVLNGKLDWVTWEELGGRKTWRAWEWSPDGSRLAYLRFDQSDVPEYPLVDVRRARARLKRQRYPKAGDPISRLQLRVAAVPGGELQACVDAGPEEGYVAPWLAWTSDGSAVAWTWLSRDQRRLALRSLDLVSGAVRTLLEESDPAWLNPPHPPVFLPGGEFLWISERSGRPHLYRHLPDGGCELPLTSGSWQVERLHGAAEGNAWLTGTGEDPRERHIYRVATDGSGVRRLTVEPGVYSAQCHPAGRWLLIQRSTPAAPPETLLVEGDGRERTVVHRPDPSWRDFDWFPAEFVDLAADDGTRLHAQLVRPAGFDPAARYPAIVFLYGGPHAQTVQKRWLGADALIQLLAQEGFLIWQLDNRGSWGRGHDFETPLDRRLGTVELADQLRGVEHLRSLPFVHPERIGIFGWSYGGFLALQAATHAPHAWRCCAAGAPVTAWELYDSAYTERYMGLPQENPEGYRHGSPVESAGQLCAPLLLIHGTADDNVHLQNTLQFLEALAKHRKPYELLLQPGQKHAFSGSAARIYLADRILSFFQRWLQERDPAVPGGERG